MLYCSSVAINEFLRQRAPLVLDCLFQVVDSDRMSSLICLYFVLQRSLTAQSVWFQSGLFVAATCQVDKGVVFTPQVFLTVWRHLANPSRRYFNQLTLC